MSDAQNETPPGPDLRADGAAFGDVPEGGMLAGHVDGEPVLLVRKGGRILAMGAACTHYHAPLGDGVFDGELVRCPWHHACFRPETGEAVRAPALDPVPTYAVETRGDRVFVTGEAEAAPRRATPPQPPESVVVVGGGAAGFAAAEMLRREGYEGPVTIVSADASAPYDRPNVSKDYLAGNAPEEWMPLRPPTWYEEKRIELVLGRTAIGLDVRRRRVRLDDGRELSYGALLLATGATPISLDVPGSDAPHVHTVRSLADGRAIRAAAKKAERAVVVGASFIGLEVAASLTARGVEVHVVAPEAVPMERILGSELGAFVRGLHEEHGVRFHLGRTVGRIGHDDVTLDDGTGIEADLVVIGIGVRPNVELAEQAGLQVDGGVLVDVHLRTSAEGVWAAGDIARWPDRRTGKRIRIEHWVVAERQGQTAARDMLGADEAFDDVPFFWSQHYDVPINYVGHGAGWDSLDVSGSVDERDCVVTLRRGGRALAVASVYRDVASLKAELALERGDEKALEAVTG